MFAAHRGRRNLLLMNFNISAKHVETMIQQLRVLVVHDNQFTRNLMRGMLGNIGVRTVFEIDDGIALLEMIRSLAPDVIVLDWDMSLLNGPELVHIVRSPLAFATPDIPIIILTDHGERWRILESVKLGVNEFLCKPVSAKALFDRLISILLKPRASVQLGEYYGPAPRSPAAAARPVNYSSKPSCAA